MKRAALWTLGAGVVHAVGIWSLLALVDAAYGPSAGQPPNDPVGRARIWMGIYGGLGLLTGLGTAHALLRRAPAWAAAVGLLLVAAPTCLVSVFSLYFLAASVGLH